ncbi:MAG: DUF885 domain-containing protein [Deltaproteobacteria bacterium]|nr:DUF885 domain-containing protein [Deltaproteobacteria bacterium]
MPGRAAMTDATFDRVNEEHLAGLVDLAPDVGTQLGLTQHDDAWPDPTENGRGAVLRHVRHWGDALEGLAPEGLTPEQAFDRKVFVAHVELVRFAHEHAAQRRHDPDVLSGVAWTLLRQLQSPWVPAEQRLANLAARLRGLDAFLGAARSVVTAPDTLWTEVARRVAAEAPALVNAVAQSARADAVTDALKEDVAHAAESALVALHAHQDWLRDLVPTGDHRILGEEKFRELCRLRALPDDPAALLETGRRFVAEYRAERRRWAQRVRPGVVVADALRLLEVDAPASFAEGLQRVHRASLAAREFVREKNLVLLPAGEELVVLETPAPLRPLIPFAALLAAPRFAPEQRSVYLVTPRADGALGGFCTPDTENTAIHEGYPGHHVQQVFANTATGLLRDGVPVGITSEPAGAWATDTIEGWAHYCEEMMREEGYRGGAPARLQIAHEALWRAHRVVLDVGLATGRTTVEEAVAALTTDLAMPQDAAVAEVARYTRTPGYPLCYLVGKQALFDLRRAAKIKWKDAYTPRRFHDLVLTAGNVPMKYVTMRLASGA